VAKYAKLRKRLEEEKRHLEEELVGLTAEQPSAAEWREGSPFGKREEGATEAAEMEKRLALEKRLREHLEEIEHALQKFDEGTYGHCDICNAEIDPERLEVLPQASLCVKCKSAQAKDAKSGAR
jgi:RNA polymerase-binding protein DksA